jgi:hypothetical protein
MASTAGIGLICEAPYCKNMQTSEKAANYGLCDEHFKATNWDCERCGAEEYQWCAHR